MPKHNLTFGIYPGGIALDLQTGIVAELVDTPIMMQRVKQVLDLLQPKDCLFLVRGYMHYLGSGKRGITTPVNMQQYVSAGRRLDLALCYRTAADAIEDWTGFIRSVIQKYGPFLEKIQITEEPNNPDVATGGDGSFPNVRQAIVAGVLAAKDESQKKGVPIQVGFNAVPSFQPGAEFWAELGQMGYPRFCEALDYVGFDSCPDVFRPLPPGLTLQEAVSGVLTEFRNASLVLGKIPATVPIHITENGWPTSETRTEEQQAIRVEEVIRTIDEKKEELNITHYEFFDLLDADHTKTTGLQFGLLHDDFTPKPAFEVFRRLVRELSATC